MKVAGTWRDIPGVWIDDQQAPDKHRWIATAYGYQKVRKYNHDEAGGRCEGILWGGERCPRAVPLDVGHLHHVYGRGLHGGKREDRRIVCGIVFTQWLCVRCHGEALIKKPDWGGKDFAGIQERNAHQSGLYQRQELQAPPGECWPASWAICRFNFGIAGSNLIEVTRPENTRLMHARRRANGEYKSGKAR